MTFITVGGQRKEGNREVVFLAVVFLGVLAVNCAVLVGVVGLACHVVSYCVFCCVILISIALCDLHIVL